MHRFGSLARKIARQLSWNPRRVLGVTLAVIAASGAMTATAALMPDAPTAPSGIPSALASSASTTSAAATGSATSAGSPFASSTTVSGESSIESAASTATGIASAIAGATGSGTSSAIAAHTNGHGCDDIIHAPDRTPAPGGPFGCEVGNSGEHRQNGKSPTGTATATPTGTSTPTGTAAASPTGDHADPHANGHGCDDVNPAVIDHQPSHGGPVGCDVGNSADHRQNGKSAATAIAVPSSTTASGAATADSTPAASHGGSGNAGKKN